MLRALSRRSMSTEAAATAPLVMFGTAGRYANAIYAASAKKGEIDQVSADLALFKETMQTSPVLNNFCIDPSMGRDEKAKGVISLLTSAKACDTTKNSLASLAEGGRLGDVVKVIDMFESIVTAGKGDVKAVITSAEALPAAELAEITKQLTGLLEPGQKNLSVETKVDPGLVAGITVEMGDKYIDYSVATQLKKLMTLLKDGM